MAVRDADARDISRAIRLLREARDLLKKAGARRTVLRVRLALTSAQGALRHAAGVSSPLDAEHKDCGCDLPAIMREGRS